MKRTVFFSLFILILPLLFFSQDSLPENNFAPSFNIHLGYLPKTYPTAPKSKYAELSSVGLMWQFNGRDAWHQYYHYPRAGVELFFGSFNNPAELGYNIGFVPTMEINSAKVNKHWKARFGIGLTYFNKPYDPITNTKNYYIGSHFTNMTALSILWDKKLNKSLNFSYGASLIHCSNGHTRLPNVGMNMVVLQAGIRVGKTITKHSYPETTEQKKKTAYSIKLGLGTHQFGATEKAIGGPNYSSYHLSVWASRPFRKIHLLQAGFTFAYYSSFNSYILSQEVDFNNPRLSSCTAVLFAGHEFVFGKFSLSTQAGLYLFNPFFIKQKKIEGRWNVLSEKAEAFSTNRLGLLYYPLKKRNTLNKINNQLMFGVFIKANLAQADLIEYSIGYVF